MDGVDTLPHQDLAAGPNGNELARTGLQLEASVAYLRNAAIDCVHEGLDQSVKSPQIQPANPFATVSRLDAESESYQGQEGAFPHSLDPLLPLRTTKKRDVRGLR